MATILVNELSAYEFRTYGTRYRGPILASTYVGFFFCASGRRNFTLTSVAVVHSVRLFSDDFMYR